MDGTSETSVDLREEARTNEHGLFVHPAAQQTIAAFVSSGLVGAYPIYLVGLVLPEHRCGPAVAALLTMPDGGVLAANARSLLPHKRRRFRRRPDPRTRVNDVFHMDVSGLNPEELLRYRQLFYDLYDGFRLPCLEASPTAAAESMLCSAEHGVRWGRDVAPSPMGPPRNFPSDWTDVVFYSQRAVGCTAEGFTPNADQLDKMPLSETLTRALQLPNAPTLSWLRPLQHRLATEYSPKVVDLVEEAWAVRRLSPRASVALLRTVAELVVAGLGYAHGKTFFAKLDALEADWEQQPLSHSPADRVENAWRSRVLACLHRVRDIGNRIHADSTVGPAEVDSAHDANRHLLEAVLRISSLDIP